MFKIYSHEKDLIKNITQYRERIKLTCGIILDDIHDNFASYLKKYDHEEPEIVQKRPGGTGSVSSQMVSSKHLSVLNARESNKNKRSIQNSVAGSSIGFQNK